MLRRVLPSAQKAHNGACFKLGTGERRRGPPGVTHRAPPDSSTLNAPRYARRHTCTPQVHDVKSRNPRRTLRLCTVDQAHDSLHQFTIASHSQRDTLCAKARRKDDFLIVADVML